MAENWGVRPWEMHKLSVRDLQDVSLSAHAKAYIQEAESESASNPGSISHDEYDVKKSRDKAFN